MHDHIKIAHNFRRSSPPTAAEYAWAPGTDMVVLDELGTDPDEALDEFRELLRQRGEL